MAIGRRQLEIHHGGRFHVVGQVTVLDDEAGYRGAARFEYDLDYVLGALGARDARAVSCRYPVGFATEDEPVWPAFLLDLMPSGAARRFWEAELGLPNTPRSDWAMLARGAGNPPGNVRVTTGEGEGDRADPRHPGFSRDEVIERGEGFLEYARAHGAPISGSSGAAGDSPKFLLREDTEGRMHADGALDDARTARSWLVKFPRSPREADRLVLSAEPGYLEVARRFGLRAGEPLVWERDALWIPRFDRVRARRGGGLARLGLESLASLAGVTDFGAPTPKDDLARGLVAYASDPLADLRELVLRDVLDLALGNTDNHARNTAVIKDARGRVALSPIYDLAPMMLDRGIARVCRWRAETGGLPAWPALAEALERLGVVGVDAAEVLAWLREARPAVRALPDTMRLCGVPEPVREAARPRVEAVLASLDGLEAVTSMPTTTGAKAKPAKPAKRRTR